MAMASQFQLEDKLFSDGHRICGLAGTITDAAGPSHDDR